MFNVVFWLLFPQNDCSTEDLHIVGAEDLSFLAGKVNLPSQNQENLLHLMVNSLLPKSNSQINNVFVSSSSILTVCDLVDEQAHTSEKTSLHTGAKKTHDEEAVI